MKFYYVIYVLETRIKELEFKKSNLSQRRYRGVIKEINLNISEINQAIKILESEDK